MPVNTINIPSRYTSTEDYAASRAALVDAENEAAFDYSAVASASAVEKKANTIVKALIRLESETLYGVHGDGSGHEPAHQFRRAKHLIDSSKIFEIARKAPKGALLHCHFDAMLPPSELIEIATRMPHMHIRTDAALTHGGFFKHALPTFQILPNTKAADCVDTSIFSAKYIPGDWMSFSKFRAAFPGGPSKVNTSSRNPLLYSSDSWQLWAILDDI